MENEPIEDQVVESHNDAAQGSDIVPAVLDTSAPVQEQIQSVDQSMVTYLRAHLWKIVVCLTAFALFEIGAIAVFVLNSAGNDNSVGAILVIVPLVVLAVAYGVVRQRIQDEFMRQFAEANGYVFSPVGSSVGLDGALFRLGRDHLVGDTVSGEYLGRPISLFLYSYVTGEGKQRQVHPYTVFRLQFDVEMPDLLLEKKESFFMGELFGQLPEHIKLEGDFNKYFSLSIKKGYEVEALEIFTPDVMAELEEKCKGLSLEIVNNDLFVYDNKTVSKKIDLDALYGVAQYFVQKLGPVLARMKGPTEAMEAVAASV
jgi:hypothetical protein